jgi:hypothetical protein
MRVSIHSAGSAQVVRRKFGKLSALGGIELMILLSVCLFFSGKTIQEGAMPDQFAESSGKIDEP